MDWGKIVVRSIITSIVITVLLGILQLILTTGGISWFAIYPPHALGASFWGLPYGWLKKIIHPEAGFQIESLYLIYDVIIWFIIALAVITIRQYSRR